MSSIFYFLIRLAFSHVDLGNYLGLDVFDFCRLLVSLAFEVSDIACNGVAFLHNVFSVDPYLTKLVDGALEVLLSNFEVVVKSLDLRLGFVSFLNGRIFAVVLNIEILPHSLKLSLCLLQVLLSLLQRLLVIGNLES